MNSYIIWNDQEDTGTEYSIVDGKIQKRNLIRKLKAIELAIQAYLSTLLRGDSMHMSIYYLQCSYPRIEITKRLLELIKEKCVEAITSDYTDDGSDAFFASILTKGCVECGKWKGFAYIPCGHIFCDSHVKSFQKCTACECPPVRIFLYENATWNILTIARILFRVTSEM